MPARGYARSGVVASLLPRRLLVYDARRGALLAEFRAREGEPSFAPPLSVHSPSSLRVGAPLGTWEPAERRDWRVLELEGGPALNPADGEGVDLADLGFEDCACGAGEGEAVSVALLPGALCVYDGACDGAALSVYSLDSGNLLQRAPDLPSRPVSVFGFAGAWAARLAGGELAFLELGSGRTSAQLLEAAPLPAPPRGPPEAERRARAALATVREGRAPGVLAYHAVSRPPWLSPALLQPGSQPVPAPPAGGPRLARAPAELMRDLLGGYRAHNGEAIRASLERISAALPRFGRAQLEVLRSLLDAYPRPRLHGLPALPLAGLGADSGPSSAGPGGAGLERALRKAGVRMAPVSDRPYDQLVVEF